jgi:thiaminase (transcriptional activator TenA)
MSAAAGGHGEFCRLAWSRTAALRQAICEHPFNQVLADGSLDERKFAYYIIQDTRYLVGCARALSMAAVRAPDPAASEFFAQNALITLEMERTIHRPELERLDPSRNTANTMRTSPVCQAYISFLEATAFIEVWPVLVAALLPCFWVYHDVGQAVLSRVADLASHPYRTWLASYSGEAAGGLVEQACRIADDAAATVPISIIGHMLGTFTRATEYEWLLWDSAWRLEEWPTARFLTEGAKQEVPSG